jgi:mRNA interferase MazF
MARIEAKFGGPTSTSFEAMNRLDNAGLKKRSWITIGQIRTLSVDRVGTRLTRASEEELARVLDGLTEILG